MEGDAAALHRNKVLKAEGKTQKADKKSLPSAFGVLPLIVHKFFDQLNKPLPRNHSGTEAFEMFGIHLAID
jgi:hypothetical protein